MTVPVPPKPPARAGRVPLWRYARLFRQDILSAQPARLYRAWMAEFRTPFFRSFLVNEPALVRRVLSAPAEEMPKSDRVGAGLRPLLGQSVFLTNGAVWARQRRIIDPAFEGGRLRDTFPAMQAAADEAVRRLRAEADGTPCEIEAQASHAAADVIFRTLFSLPITDAQATEVFAAFRAYQRSAPILNLAALLPVPAWLAFGTRRRTREAASRIRRLIRAMTDARLEEIGQGRAPEDLATKIMTTVDPETGQSFDSAEMADQVAIFFLAGHETSASALAWALYLLATHPEAQARVAAEAEGASGFDFADLSRLGFTRDVFREALRLYPPVPMMVRSATRPETFRKRRIRRGDQIVLSPWHLHRHERIWDRPDHFDPDRWQDAEPGRCPREAYIPFSAGPRACPGAGFAMVEGTLLLARIVEAFHLAAAPERTPVPVAHLTVRAEDGIWLKLRRRERSG